MSTSTNPLANRRLHIIAWAIRILLAAAFLAAGAAKLAGLPAMVHLFEQIGAGQWFRIFTGVTEVTVAIAILVPRLSRIGATGMAITMCAAIATHALVLHTSPAPAIGLLLLSVASLFMRRTAA